MIQQKSPGDGRYYARLYSGLHSEVVATASNFFMNCLPVEEEAEAEGDLAPLIGLGDEPTAEEWRAHLEAALRHHAAELLLEGPVCMGVCSVSRGSRECELGTRAHRPQHAGQLR